MIVCDISDSRMIETPPLPLLIGQREPPDHPLLEQSVFFLFFSPASLRSTSAAFANLPPQSQLSFSLLNDLKIAINSREIPQAFLLIFEVNLALALFFPFCFPSGFCLL